ncbi:MAG: SsgA family sporulation/cell division regulator [Pseudonocardiaceae bacterium]
MNAHSGGPVAHDMFALLHQSAAPVVTRWTYYVDDPFAVTLAIQTRGDQCVDWVLARDLLVAGLSAPAGIGDVQVRPARIDEWDVALIEIRSPDGHALLEVDRDLLQQFVDATIEAIPLGSESTVIDLDAEIEKITRAAGWADGAAA